DQVRRRSHRRRARRAAGLRAAHRMEAAPVALVFIGFMGAGKTSAARAAASMLDGRAVDDDHEIERRTGITIDEYFERYGESAFRQVEEEVVLELLDRPPSPALS